MNPTLANAAGRDEPATHPALTEGGRIITYHGIPDLGQARSVCAGNSGVWQTR